MAREWKLAPALCLDLDGTVRRSKMDGGFVKNDLDVELFPDVEGKLWEYRTRGYLIIGISNQGGVASGHKTHISVLAEVDATRDAFKKNPFHVMKCCYHDARGSVFPFNNRSLCRKPSYGMLAIVEQEAHENGWVIDWDKSIFVGDRPEDEACAVGAGLAFSWAWDFFGRPDPR
jgi:D-glycero-D-manno-heptose 1,7-bisphosphate phosphatase